MSTLYKGAATAGEAIKRKRYDQGKLGLRTVDKMSQALEAQSDIYSRAVFTTLGHIERRGDRWFKESPDAGIIHSLVHILWRGDYDQWFRDTGVKVPLPMFAQAADPAEAPVMNVPLWIEGERPYDRSFTPRMTDAPLAGADFIFQTEAIFMSPVVFPKQRVGCIHSNIVTKGELAVLLTSRGLELAWAAGERRFMYENRHSYFRLEPGERVYGVVRYIIPERPLFPAQQQMAAAV